MSAAEMLGYTNRTVYEYQAPGENVDGELLIDPPVAVDYPCRVQAKTDGLEQYQTFSTERRLRMDGAIVIKGDTPLATESLDGLTPASVIDFRGKFYRVVASDDNRHTVLPHCLAIALLDPHFTAPEPEPEEEPTP